MFPTPVDDQPISDGDDNGDDVTDLINLANIQNGTYASAAQGSSSRPTSSRSHVYVNTQRLQQTRQRPTHQGNNNKLKVVAPRETRASHVKDQVIIGHGQSTRLRASSRTQGNITKERKAVGIFITRLHPRPSATTVDAHVRDETGCIVKCERLVTKYDTYSSFCVRCNDSIAQKLLDPTIWPKGAMVKRYFD